MCYAFRAEDLEIFISEDDDCFIASHLICSKCNAFWYTDLAECYLCGEINYNLNVCEKNHYSSQQASTKNCQICKKSTEKKCINEKCPSNTNKYIKNIINAKRKKNNRGVFERGESSFRTSQLHCVKCGNTENIYKYFQVHLVD